MALVHGGARVGLSALGRIGRLGVRRSGPVDQARSGDLIDPRSAAQIRRAAAMQRDIGVGRFPGMSHEEFESQLLMQITRLGR